MNKLTTITIAVVDDHQIFLDGMISVLKAQKNFKILFVENSVKKALENLSSTNIIPDIIITDISMPEMNGLEFIKIINKDFPQIKIMVLSMFDNLQTIDEIDGYLLKETNKDELIKAINTIVTDGKKYFSKKNSDINTFEFKKSILTIREKEIIRLITEEYTTDEIANSLAISKGTIESHRKNIFFKLNVKNIAGLVKKAIYLGI